jgi:peptidoglycan/LPS O-acetylase OafA/YrhL
MPSSESPAIDRLSKIRLYRRLMYGAVLAGTAGFAVASAVDRTLIGVALYWAGFLAFLGLWRGTAVTLFDERDCALERRASHVTLNVLAAVGILAWPSVVVLSEVTDYSPPPEYRGGLLAFAAVYVVFAAVYVALRYRS